MSRFIVSVGRVGVQGEWQGQRTPAGRPYEWQSWPASSCQSGVGDSVGLCASSWRSVGLQAVRQERHLAYQWQGTQHQVILVCFFYGLNSWELCLQLSLSISTWDNLLVKALGFWLKGCKFESWQKRRENVLLQSQLYVLTLIRCPFHPRVTAVARKRPRSLSQKYRWQVTPKHA